MGCSALYLVTGYWLMTWGSKSLDKTPCFYSALWWQGTVEDCNLLLAELGKLIMYMSDKLISLTMELKCIYFFKWLDLVSV